MSRHTFYDRESYRRQQSKTTELLHEQGVYRHLDKHEKRVCKRKGCLNSFKVQPANPKKFCSQSCAAIVNNTNRKWPDDVKKKISKALTGKVSPTKGLVIAKRVSTRCQNGKCRKRFMYERYRSRSYCSVACSMHVTGSKPTSPKASRGKAGIRTDISRSIYFYSRWEANMARLFTRKGISWEYAPRTFDIGNQNYTPDFYLPERKLFIEIKNFWNEHSATRDKKFRKAYPKTKLKVILKDEYLFLEKRYAAHIPKWEYKT